MRTPFGVTAFVGLWGSGKTLAMVEEGREALADGCELYSNFGYRGAHAIETFDDLLVICAEPTRVRRHIMLDELGMLLPAREYNKWPPALNVIFMQGRKFGISLSYTSQHFDFLDANIRRVTSRVAVCRGHFAKRVSAPGEPRETRPRLFSRSWYTGEQYGSAKAERLSFELRRFDPEVADLYDTHALISTAQAVLTKQVAAIQGGPQVVVVKE